jgi:hypothetical protein
MRPAIPAGCTEFFPIAFIHPAAVDQGRNQSKKSGLRFAAFAILKPVGEDAD